MQHWQPQILRKKPFAAGPFYLSIQLQGGKFEDESQPEWFR